MSDRSNVSVSSDSKELIASYAEQKGCTVGEAADKLIATAIGRLAALGKYAKAVKKEEKAKASKKATKKKTAKAKPATHASA